MNTTTEPFIPSRRDYQRIEHAIAYLVEHADGAPNLAELAEAVHLSPHHLQRLFVAWAGVSPKEFSQALTLAHARALLDDSRSILQTATETGLSGPSRLHDLFVRVECMTPGEYKREGADLTIHWARADTPFGPALFAGTDRGLCHLSFANGGDALEPVRSQWPGAALVESNAAMAGAVAEVNRRMQGLSPRSRLGLLLKGSPLRLKVWQALLGVPWGRAVSYAQLAETCDKPRAVRAVASSVAVNPVAFLIPCHRVIRSTGAVGQYRWGPVRKQAMLAREHAG